MTLIVVFMKDASCDAVAAFLDAAVAANDCHQQGSSSSSGAEHRTPRVHKVAVGDELSSLVGDEQISADDAHFAMCYTRPEPIVARAIDNSDDVTGALAHWREEVLAMLEIHRANRRRSLGFFDEDILSDPDWFAGKVSERFDIDFEPPGGGTGRPLVDYDRPLLGVLSGYVVRQLPDIAELLAEVEASCLAGKSVMIEPESAIRDYHASLGRGDVGVPAGQVDHLREERDTLLKELYYTQEQYEQAISELSNVSASAEWRQKDIDALHASLSWRLTAPLRALLRPFVGKAES